MTKFPGSIGRNRDKPLTNVAQTIVMKGLILINTSSLQVPEHSRTGLTESRCRTPVIGFRFTSFTTATTTTERIACASYIIRTLTPTEAISDLQQTADCIQVKCISTA